MATVVLRGSLTVTGRDAGPLLNSLCPRRLPALDFGSGHSVSLQTILLPTLQRTKVSDAAGRQTRLSNRAGNKRRANSEVE